MEKVWEEKYLAVLEGGFNFYCNILFRCACGTIYILKHMAFSIDIWHLTLQKHLGFTLEKGSSDDLDATKTPSLWYIFCGGL